MDELNKVQSEIINFMKTLPDIYPHDVKDAFRAIRQKFKTYEDNPYERRAFLYLDIISWLDSKIENIPVDQIIRRKYLESIGE